MLRLNMLGTPSLERDGTRLALTVRKSLALLLLLARHAAPMPRARVAAFLWPKLDEATGRRNLRRELARLREAGAADAVRVDGDGLTMGDVEFDVDAVDAELAAGRPAGALALFRGPPADGFELGDADAFDDWLAREREQLGEVRRRALRASAVESEAAGDLATALVRIESLLDDDPLQEQHHRDAMRLLAAGGRREAALARYERCCTLLRHELGLAPMAETEALAAALRAGPAVAVLAPRPDADAPAPPARLPDVLPFVGRAAEVAAMEAAWSQGHAIVIEAEGGVGKTRLAADFCAAHGPYALARCRPGDGDVPYASFARALRALMGPVPALPAELPAWVGAEVARLVPELGPAAAPLRTDDERNRFYEACASAWQALSGDDFDAVVIDDWHLADAASRTLFAFVMRRRHEAGRGGMREVVVLRPELDDDGHEALRLLVVATAALHLRLAALSGAEVFSLVQQLSGAGEPTRFAHRLARATGGNPFFLAETLRHLAESKLLSIGADGAWLTPFDASTEDYREIPVPASVQETVLARARRLSPAAGRVLEAAALAAEPFEPKLLAPACALSELDAVLAIESGVAAGLLHEHAAGGYAFAHDLVQQALASSLSSERRRLVHRRLALGAEAAAAPAATIAAHHEASGDPARAVAHRMAAGDEAKRLRALPDAIAHWTQALADLPTPAQALRLRERLAKAAYDRTDFTAVREQAEAIAGLIDGGELSAEDRMGALIARGLALARAGDGTRALQTLDALPGEPTGRQRFDALWARAVTLDELGRTDQAMLAVHAALALPDLGADDRGELHDFAFYCEFNAGRNDAALVHADAALALAARLGNGLGLARNHFRRGIVMLTVHDTDGAVAELLAAAADAERLGLVQLERIALYNLTCAYAAQSRHAQARAAAERGWNLTPPLETSDFRVMYRLALVDAHFALGDLGACWREAEPAIMEAIANTDPRVRIGAASCTLELLGMLGEKSLARRLLATIGRDDARALKAAADEMWIARAQFELRIGDAAAAASALAELDATGDAVVARVRVRAAQARAELALTGGDAAAALALLPADETLGMNGEMRSRGLAVRIAAEAASGTLALRSVDAALAALASPSDHAIATLELHTALEKAAQGGVVGAPESPRAARSAFVAALGTTLRDHPMQQAAFERTWA